MENIKQDEMQCNVAVGKTTGLPRLEKRIMGARPAIDRQEAVFSVRSLAESHIISEPTLDPPFLVIIRARTFLREFIPALEAVDVELPHVFSDSLEILDSLVVQIVPHPLQ